MQSIIVLGADRVGKSTTIKNTEKLLRDAGYRVKTMHFTGIQPHHHSPVEQFSSALEHGVDSRELDYLLIDRFISDTLFYEPYRYKMPKIPTSFAIEAESHLYALTQNVKVAILTCDWSEKMQARHVTEILEKNPESSRYWIVNQVNKVRDEHEAYYKHTSEYFSDLTTIVQRHIHYIDMSNADPEFSLVETGIIDLADR